jgi:hypothetical protein
LTDLVVGTCRKHWEISSQDLHFVVTRKVMELCVCFFGNVEVGEMGGLVGRGDK